MNQKSENKSLGEYILIDRSDMPSVEDLTATVERLEKDIATLSSMGASKYKDQAKSLAPVLSYLKLLLTRSKK
jgi:hypothetical protein